MTKIKICGITNYDDAMMAIDLGAWALGFNFYPSSQRFISFSKAQEIISKLPPEVEKVGVFVNASAQVVKNQTKNLGLTLVQLHGDETPEYCSQFSLETLIKALRPEIPKDIAALANFGSLKYILIDSAGHRAYGGSGKKGDWSLAKKAKDFGSVILAGGLTPENVTQAIVEVNPFGVDVTSGVEGTPGTKDKSKMKKFFEMVNQNG
jgi:phosphoribosylanthranilate isomerase